MHPERDQVAERTARHSGGPRAGPASCSPGAARALAAVTGNRALGAVLARRCRGVPPGAVVHPEVAALIPPMRDRLLARSLRAQVQPAPGRELAKGRLHTDGAADALARAVAAREPTAGADVHFGRGEHGSGSIERRRPSVSHAAATTVQRTAGPHIKKITVHLTPPQSAELEWEGTPPSSATGSDSFTVSTGKGYGDPDDPPGTCTRGCCSDPDTQCAPPWNQPTKVGACCTYYGSNFWAGTPEAEHGGWKYWTPIQPHYSKRAIALHQHTEVTGQPIGHGCVRMDEENAQRIYDYSRGRRTRVDIDGRAAPVACDTARKCDAHASADGDSRNFQLAEADLTPMEGLEGEMS